MLHTKITRKVRNEHKCKQKVTIPVIVISVYFREKNVGKCNSVCAGAHKLAKVAVIV